jgi:hypothetical protein
MKPFPKRRRRIETLPTHDEDEDELPARFREARTHVQAAVRRAESDGVPGKALGLALMSEALPRIVKEHGRAWAATVLTRLAERISAGLF